MTEVKRWAAQGPQGAQPIPGAWTKVELVSAASYDALAAEFTELKRANAELMAALNELHAMVMGECPSLLNEDSGGSARLALKIEDLLADRERAKK